MAGKKQVMDMRSTTSGVSSQESDEQQRNWTKQHWEKKAKDRGHMKNRVAYA